MEYRKEGNGVTCPEEGWKWYVSDKENSTYEEKDRLMNMCTWLSDHGKAEEVYIGSRWYIKGAHGVPATPEERIMIYQRVQRAVEFLGLNCVVKVE